LLAVRWRAGTSERDLVRARLAQIGIASDGTGDLTVIVVPMRCCRVCRTLQGRQPILTVLACP
jgi:hypothetical protein